jgi:hypothetical protein
MARQWSGSFGLSGESDCHRAADAAVTTGDDSLLALISR